jgi:hypothetical protein
MVTITASTLARMVAEPWLKKNPKNKW